MIEVGRYHNIPRERRFCPLCKSNQVENENNFFFQCNRYTLQWQNFLNRINEIIPDIERKSTYESLNLLMNSNDCSVTKIVIKFISTCINIRNTLSISNKRNVSKKNIRVLLALFCY